MVDAIEAVDLSAITPTEIPDDVSDAPHDIACVTCGKDIAYLYKGKGRKPKYCEDHKPQRSASNLGTRRTASGAVGTAVQNLENMYGMAAAALFMFGAKGAASELSNSVPGLSAQNAAYLATDPELVKMINRVGKTGGRAGFFIANAMVLGPVAMSAYMELAAAREAKQAAYEEAQAA